MKFSMNTQNEETDLKKVKAQILQELKEKEQDKKEWYDKEMDKNLNGRS